MYPNRARLCWSALQPFHPANCLERRCTHQMGKRNRRFGTQHQWLATYTHVQELFVEEYSDREEVYWLVHHLMIPILFVNVLVRKNYSMCG